MSFRKRLTRSGVLAVEARPRAAVATVVVRFLWMVMCMIVLLTGRRMLARGDRFGDQLAQEQHAPQARSAGQSVTWW
ncbi:hypothetical protein Sros01_36770 [Streptomyces roseochromogenus]|nr:hypothetical protein Sros01_36770 [Streptomyces roseochromogenus]